MRRTVNTLALVAENNYTKKVTVIIALDVMITNRQNFCTSVISPRLIVEVMEYIKWTLNF